MIEQRAHETLESSATHAGSIRCFPVTAWYSVRSLEPDCYAKGYVAASEAELIYCCAWEPSATGAEAPALLQTLAIMEERYGRMLGRLADGPNP
jgi:hypothetical protein